MDYYLDSRSIPSLLFANLTPLPRTMVDGQESTGGMVTHEVVAPLEAGPRKETARFDVTMLQSYLIMLGIPWLKEHDPPIHQSQHCFASNSRYCLDHCNLNKHPTV